MERKEAINKLKHLEGKNLHELAAKYGVTVEKNGKINKGWAGHVFERFLELPINSAQSPNFGSWELKSVPLKRLRSGCLSIKETMAITMIDPINVMQKEFEDSHVYSKLRKAVIVARIVGDDAQSPTFVHSVNQLDLKGDLYDKVKQDYDEVRGILIKDPVNGFDSLSGRMGIYIQPRTKGAGHGSQSRAFYARKRFLEKFINLS